MAGFWRIIRRLYRRAPLLPEYVVVCAILALIWSGCAATLVAERHSSLDRAARDAANLSRVLDGSLDRLLSSADQTLLMARSAMLNDPVHFDVTNWARDFWAGDWYSAQLAVFDAKGALLSSGSPGLVIDVTDRDYYRIHRDTDADRLLFSRPVMGRSSQRMRVLLSRRTNDADGKFAGGVVLSLDCDELSQVYSTLAVDHGTMTVVGLDGIILAHSPMKDALVGKSFALAKLPGTILSGAGGARHRDGMTLSYRRLERYPLIVAVTLDDADTLATYRKMLSSLALKGLIATGVILLAGWLWIKQRRRSIASQIELTMTLESMGEGLVMVDERGCVRVANERALELLNLPATLLTALRGTDVPARELAEVSLLSALDRQCTASRLRLPNPDLPQRVIEVSSSPFPEGGAVHVLTDVTARHLALQRVRHLAMHDPLTGLGNGALLAETIDEWLAASPAAPFALLSLRLGRFKRVRETLGQEHCEELLLMMVARLQPLVTLPDLLFRRDADDFAVLTRRSRSLGQALDLARSLQAAFADAFLVSGQMVRLDVAIGLSLTADGGGRTELLQRADLACSEASARPACPVLSFTPDMMERMQSRVLLEQEVRAALAGRQLYLDYQPQFRASTLEVIGFEALIRWCHPTRGRIGPSSFISVAEETGLIIELGHWILREACAAAVHWPPHVRLAINLSPVQFRDPHLIETISRALTESGLPAGRLELEVTEGVLIQDEHQALDTLLALKRLGLRLALDDFGTGYSSLSYLRKFPFERIKLDRSFVQAQVNDERSRQILQCILDMSSKLGLDVIAEGVETPTQLMLLRQQGCQDVQGFLVGKPMSAEQACRTAGATAAPIAAEPIPARCTEPTAATGAA